MKLLIGCAVALSAAAALESLQLGVEEGAKATKTFSNTVELELVDLTLEIEDEVIEVPADQRGEFQLSNREDIVFTDVYGAVEDGRAGKIVRTFDSLSSETTQVSEAPGSDGPTEDTREGASELEGKAVVFTWDADEEAYSTAFDEDDDGSDDLLDDLDGDADFLFLLPEGGFGEEVELGSSWEVDASAFNLMTGPSGDLKIEDDEEEDEDDDTDEQFDDNLTGDFEATLQAVEDGVATIALKFEGSTEAETEMSAGEDELVQTLALDFECEGEMLWNLELGAAESVTFGGAVTMTVTVQADGERSFTQTQTFEGELEFSAEFEWE